MIIPTESIGSIPRPLPSVEALRTHDGDDPAPEPLYEVAARDTIGPLKATGSPVTSGGGQRKQSHFGRYGGHLALSRFSEKERERIGVLKIIAKSLKSRQRAFVGLAAPIDPRIETPEEVSYRSLATADYLRPRQRGATDDGGVSPFCDEVAASRGTAFAQIHAHVPGTAMAAEAIGGG